LVAALVLVFACLASRYAFSQTATRPENTPTAQPPGSVTPKRTARPATGAKAANPSQTPAAAWAAFYAGDLDRAATLAKAALSENAAHTGARLVLARVAMARGDAEGSYAELRRAQQLTPDDPDLLYYLALVSGDLARLAFEALYAMAPDSGRVHQLMAESLDAEDKPAAAAAEYEAALRADAKLLDALLGLGKVKRTRLQQCDEAIGLYQRAEAIRPTFDGAFGLGTCLAVLENDERAIAQFRIALQRDPKAAVAWEGLGSALARSGRLDEGIKALERAVAIAPRMSEAYYSLGQAYRKSGNEERSRLAFEKARELQADDRQ